MNITTVEGLAQSDVPRFEDFKVILASTLMFDHLKEYVKDEDEFFFDKRDDMYILLHESKDQNTTVGVMMFNKDTFDDIPRAQIGLAVNKYIPLAWTTNGE